MNKTKIFLKNSWFLLKNTGAEAIEDKVPKLAASLSYYTIFSLPPLLIIIIYLTGIFFGAEAVRGELFGQINGLVGNSAASQIQEMIKNVKLSDSNGIAAVLGVLTLLIGASGVFTEIQDSINYIWGLKAKPKRGLIKFLKNRITSFSMVASMGFLLMVGLIVNSIMDVISNKLQTILPDFTISLFYCLNIVILFLIITLLFTVIFRTLPDGKVSFRDGLKGAGFTAILFMIGKFIIGYYLAKSATASTYGVAGSLIIILLWIYYSAIILYSGAEFTKVYAKNFGKGIVPDDYAVEIVKEIESEPSVVNHDN